MAKNNKFILILDNVRSAHNVGAIWRSASAFGVDSLALVGVTPHPPKMSDMRLPHVQKKDGKRIAKTALGAELQVPFKYFTRINSAIAYYKKLNYKLYALEQSQASTPIVNVAPDFPCALMVGNEVTGLAAKALGEADAILEIPLQGSKKSLNVAVATGIALHHFGKQQIKT